jgi:transposase
VNALRIDRVTQRSACDTAHDSAVAILNERQDDWREGIAAAFTHFGGVTRTLLGDNARALVVGRERATGTVVFHPAYLAFCRDWDGQPRACAPYRARTKGKTEAGVKFVKRNGLAAQASRAPRSSKLKGSASCVRSQNDRGSRSSARPPATLSAIPWSNGITSLRVL